MACISSPEPDEQSLLAYVDGEAEPDVQRHVEQCPYCQQRVRKLAALQDRLTARLYRAVCPTPHELGEYHLGILSQARADAIARHLSDCPHCTREVNQLDEYLRELAPSVETNLSERVKEGVRVLVARLVSGGLSLGLSGQLDMAPAYVGVRGVEREAPLVYQADDVQVIVKIEVDTERPDRVAMLGLVIGLDIVSEYEIHLWRAGQRVATASVDDLGNFVLPGLPPANYELILAGPDLEIRIERIQVGDTGTDCRDGKDP